MATDFGTILTDVRGLVTKFQSDPAKYEDVIAKGEDGFKAVANFVNKLAVGDVKAADVVLTEWEDVNATLLADAAQKAENVNDKAGITFEEVVDIATKLGRVAAIGISIASMAGLLARKAPVRRVLARMAQAAPVLSAADLEAKAKEIATAVCAADGSISWAGIFQAVVKCMEVAELVAQGLPAMTGEDKKALVIELLDYLVDTVDLPGPSFIVKPTIKTILPHVIDTLIAASNGNFKLG